jgi:hypothetical protein
MASAREELERRRRLLYTERDRWLPRWRAISEHCCPYRGAFTSTQPNRGDRRDSKILKSTPVRALRTMAAGMHSGLTSPARPWFKLGTRDKSLAQRYDVRRWLDEVQRRMYAVYQGSNFYNSIHSIYAELGAFGTACMMIMEDYEDVIRCRAFTIGEYALGVGPKGRVDSIYRTAWLTAMQMVREFGLENVSPAVRTAYQNTPELWISFYHAIEPNDDRMDLPGVNGRAFRDVYWEATDTGQRDQFLSVSGWNECPLMGPRWEVCGSDVYGNGPGDVAIGDTKMLMRMVEDKLVGLDRVVDPPVALPESSRGRGDVNALPGGVTFFSDTAAARPGALYQVTVPLGELREDIMETAADVEAAFFVDMFLMLATSDRRQITAREVAERHEEKLLMLGPVLDRLQNELLDPAIERTFEIMARLTMAGGEPMIPPPPQSLQGQQLEIELVSILAQAQKMVATAAIEQTASFVGSLAGVKPDVLDKLDADEAVDQYAEALGAPTAIIVPDEQVAKIRAARQQQQAQAAAMQQAMAGAQAAKTLSEADTGTNNALTALMGGGGR